MPKRKSVPKPHTVHGADRGAGQTLTATVGDVIEYLHTDTAIELLYAQDNLAAGRPLHDPVALMGHAVVRDTVDIVEDMAPAALPTPVSARDENAAEATSRPSSGSSSTPAAKPASVLRFLSPTFVVTASRGALGELLGGVRRARRELHRATTRARRCFLPS